ncbi:hypothetical protein OHA01_04460 [Micromonospora zamorensis]|uniref:hypothetical protein n=1 Tax=Micromonospora zamorensis TaxID=709883 RepID=UPI00386DD6A0|nr:hypothetical protein OHA01_04460 [Micromonospora zamorensis]
MSVATSTQAPPLSPLGVLLHQKAPLRSVVAPRLVRLPAQDLTEHIRAAVNAALDDLDSQRPELPAAELDSLAGGLQEVQDRSLRQMAQMNEALQDVVALLREPRR